MVLKKKLQKQLLKRLSNSFGCHSELVSGSHKILYLQEKSIMEIKKGLLSICNDCPSEIKLSFFDLLIFTVGSIVVISILLIYYNRIPKSTKQISKLENPIYQSKDILLQSKIEDANYLTTEKSTSLWVKALIYIMIGIVVFTPLYKLLGTDYFL